MISRWRMSEDGVRYYPSGPYVLYTDYELEVAALQKKLAMFEQMNRASEAQKLVQESTQMELTKVQGELKEAQAKLKKEKK